jgi:enoyl-CoA hydratase/carnithine racemase
LLVEAAVQDGVGVLRLADPARRNVLSKALSDDLESTAIGMAQRAAKRSPEVVTRTKQTLLSAARSDIDAAFRQELEAQRWSMAQPSFKEAVRRMQQQIEDKKRRRQSGLSDVREGSGQ